MGGTTVYMNILDVLWLYLVPYTCMPKCKHIRIHVFVYGNFAAVLYI